jgi:membrane protein DedA with SNARE-associated domain
MSNLLARVAQWAVGIVYSFGYFGIAFTVLAGTLHLPLPTGLILPLAGYLIWQGRLSFVPVLLAATVGALAGGIVLYLLGRWFGEERLRRLIEKVERFKIVSTSHLNTADAMFERYGTKAILIGHLIPGVGNYISIPAGVTRMPFWRQFVINTVIGSLPYNVAHIVLGWALGSQWRQAEQYASDIKYVIPLAIVVAVIWYLLRRLEGRWEARVYLPGSIPYGWERHERREGGYLRDGRVSWEDGRPAATRAVGT